MILQFLQWGSSWFSYWSFQGRLVLAAYLQPPNFTSSSGFLVYSLCQNCLQKHEASLIPNIILEKHHWSLPPGAVQKLSIHCSTAYSSAAHSVVCESICGFSTFINGFPIWHGIKFFMVWLDQNYHASPSHKQPTLLQGWASRSRCRRWTKDTRINKQAEATASLCLFHVCIALSVNIAVTLKTVDSCRSR